MIPKKKSLKSTAEILNAPGSTKVSFLVNTHYYFLGTVFILPEASGYRLVVLHKCKALTNET